MQLFREQKPTAPELPPAVIPDYGDGQAVAGFEATQQLLSKLEDVDTYKVPPTFNSKTKLMPIIRSEIIGKGMILICKMIVVDPKNIYFIIKIDGIFSQGSNHLLFRNISKL